MLKTLMLRKKLDDKKKLLEELRKKAEGFAVREAELEQSITEAETEEEQKAVEEAVDAFEEEKKSHSEQTAALEQEIAAMEQQISEAEEKQRAAAVQYEKRGNNSVKANYKTNFFGMSVQERDAFFADTRVKNFLSEVRALRAQHGSISGAELTIPDAMLETTGLPFVYHHWAENSAPPLPFLVYYFPQRQDFYADNGNYQKIAILDVELYTDTKDFTAEQRVEDVLAAHDISYTKTETYIDSEQMYEVLYEMEILAEVSDEQH